MLKKIISSVMSVCMLISAMAIITVNAESPIIYDGTTVNVFDQSFAGLSSKSDIPDFTVSGTWDYTNYHMLGGKGIHRTVDMTGADGYEFTTETIITHNGFIIDLGWNEDTQTGYQIYVQYKNGAFLYKNEEFAVSDRDLSTPAGATASSTFTNVYSSLFRYTVKVSGKILTMTAKNLATGAEYTALTYADEDLPSLSGAFGVRNCGTGNFTVFNMKLDRINNNTVVNNWRYEKTFSSMDTAEQLEKDGITFTGDAIHGFYDAGVYTGGGTTTTFSPNGGVVSGDYTFETAFTKQMNGYQVQFNYVDSNNYYAVHMHNYNISLKKVSNATGEKVETTIESYDAESGLATYRAKVAYKISVTENSDGSLGISATVSAGSESKTFTYTDTEPFVQRGVLRVAQVGYTGGSAGNSILHYIKAYATPSGAVTGTRDVTVVDKVFKSEDTVASLTNEGFVFVTTPVNIATPADLTKSGVTYPYGTKYNYSSSYSTNGISWNNASSTGNTGKVYYNKTLSGDYTVTATTKVQYNATDFYINRVDSNNYYRIRINSNGKTVKLYKKVGGTAYAESKFTVTGSWDFGEYNGFGCTTTIDVKHNDNGGIDFTITCQTAPWVNEPAVFTVTDDGVTNGKIVSSGVFRTEIGTNRGAFYDLKIVEHQKIVDDGEYKGDFYNGSKYISTYENGNIYFDFPTAAVGDYKVVAALYEDNAMTEVKTFDPIDLYAGKIQLFDTSDSTAEEASIKVYLIDTTSTLNKITQVWELK